MPQTHFQLIPGTSSTKIVTRHWQADWHIFLLVSLITKDKLIFKLPHMTYELSNSNLALLNLTIYIFRFQHQFNNIHIQISTSGMLKVF